jgi:hypothetical protein
MRFRSPLPRRGSSRVRAPSKPTLTRLTVEALESRHLLSSYTLGPLVQVSGTSPFAGSTADNLPPEDILLHSENENYVAVDPKNPNHLVVLCRIRLGWQGRRYPGPATGTAREQALLSGSQLLRPILGERAGSSVKTSFR